MSDNAFQDIGGWRSASDGAYAGTDGVARALESIDEFDLRLLYFVVSWAAYGGPPAEEVLPRFGIPSDQIGQRVREVAKRYREARICFQDRAVMARALAWVRQSGGVCRS